MKRNLLGNIYGRSSIKVAHFILIGQKTKNMVDMGNSCFWLNFKKNSHLKLGGTANCFFVEWCIYGRYCIKFSYFVLIVQLICSCFWLTNVKKKHRHLWPINLPEDHHGLEPAIIKPCNGQHSGAFRGVIKACSDKN